MKLIKLFGLIIILAIIANAQDNLPIVKSNTNVISIKDGDEFKQNSWTLAPKAKPDVYETSVKKGVTKKVTFQTDIDSISFDVKAGEKYDFIVQKGDVKCYTQIKANELNFWNDREFWESSSLKTPYKANISDEEKIAGLSKFWSEAKYNFINFPLVPDLDWDKTYLEFIPKVLATKSTLEYYKVLMLFCAKLKDGHTNIFLPSELSDEYYSRLPIATRLVEDKIIIINVLEPGLKDEGLAVGQEIVEINSVPAKKYAEENVLPYAVSSTKQDTDSNVYQRALFFGAAGTSVNLKIKDLKGKLFDKTLTRLTPQERNKLIKQDKPFECRWLEGNVALVEVNTMNDFAKADQLFADKFAEISKANALIIDLRNNGGGSSGIGYRILSFLVDKPFKGSRWFTREYHPTFRPWGRPDKTYGENAYEFKMDEIQRMRGKPEPFLKPVIVLSSPRTFSAAEDFLVAFKPLKRGLIIGEPSGGSTGQPLQFSLPGGGGGRICSKHDTFPDGTAFIGVGVLPDISVSPKISDFTEGKDYVLEVALKELKKK